MCTILIFSRDPGGANTVMPLVVPLEQKGYRVLLFGKDASLKKYADYGLPAQSITDEIEHISSDEIKQFLVEKNVGMVITGTSSDDMTEKLLWKSCEDLGLISFAILDNWVNYGLRFSPYGISESQEFEKTKRIVYLPTKIFVMDERAKNEAIEDGLDANRIVVTGQPYFETLITCSKTGKEVSKIRGDLGVTPEGKMILFVSEPLSEMYGETDDDDHYLGYTERTVFKEFLNTIRGMGSKTSNWTIVVRYHPKERSDNFSDLIASGQNPCRIIVDKNSSPIELARASDLVVGMYSMLLVEAAILRKKVMSIQLGLSRRDPLVLSRMGYLRTITDTDNLRSSLRCVFQNELAENIFAYTENPVENVVNEVDKAWQS